MKIVEVIDVFDTAVNGGVVSTQRFVEQLRHQHQVTVISTGAPQEGKVLVRPYRLPGLQRMIQKHDMVLARPEPRVLREVMADADVVHVQLPLFLGMRAVEIARQMEKPLITSFHVQPEHILYNLGITAPGFSAKMHRMLISKFYSRSDAVICPSHFGERELRKFGLQTRTEVISNGIDPTFSNAKLIEPTRDGLFRIVNAGRLAREKRQHMLLEAVAQSKYRERIEVILVGRGPREQRLRRLAARLPIRAQILSAGTPNDEMVEHYHRSHLYVHAAELELEGMTVLEAMACGLTPLIAEAPKSAASQFALDDRSRFKDVSDLTRKIDYWIENPDELLAASVAHQASTTRYSLANSTRRLEAVYASAIAKSSRFGPT